MPFVFLGMVGVVLLVAGIKWVDRDEVLGVVSFTVGLCTLIFLLAILVQVCIRVVSGSAIPQATVPWSDSLPSKPGG